MELSQCDQEPIHRPGAIQPHGVLLVVDPHTYIIQASAGDLQAFIGLEGTPVGTSADELLGKSLSTVITGAGLQIRREPMFLGSYRRTPADRDLSILAHQRGEHLLLELEPSPTDRPSAATFLARLETALGRIKQQGTIPSACAAAASEVRSFTGYDRALVYQFIEDGAGKVVGEDGNGSLPSFMNQHFPASDIPRQARELYRTSLIRVIPDVDYVPAEITPAECAVGLDMSDCSLRSVSPVHIQYLKNMDVAASMSVSVLINNELWGLIACHSSAPTFVPYETREACKQIGSALAQQIQVLTARADADEAQRLSNEREHIVAMLASSTNLEAELICSGTELMRLIPADGLIVSCRDQIARHGTAPTEEDCRALARWVRQQEGPGPYSTPKLSDDYSAAAQYRAQVSGALAIRAGPDGEIQILWLRAEYAETVEWAGHPHKSAATPAGGMLNPRASFELWREEVRGRSLPWTSAEILAAQRFGEALERIGERQRITQLQSSLIHVSRVNAMGTMASSIAHELNQPLTALSSYSRSAAKLLRAGGSSEEAAGILDRVTDQSLRAGVIIRQLRRLVSSREAQARACRLSEIIEDACSISLIGTSDQGVDIVTEYDGETEVEADCVQIQQVLVNLIRNSLDAMVRSEIRRLRVTASVIQNGLVKISVCDTGSGVPPQMRAHLFDAFNSVKEGGLGIGLSICRTIVEAHGGKIWLEEPEGIGACFSFTLKSHIESADDR